MITFFVFLGFFQVLSGFSLLEIAQYLSTPFHEKCLSWIPLQESGSEIRRALLCGQNIENPELKNQLIEIGLIHLVVVSGAHLEFLSRTLRRLKIPHPLILALLGLFLLISNFQAPAVRSLLDQVVGQFIRHNSLLWSGLLALCLFPEWIQSLSFWMSLCAATIIRLPSYLLDKERPLFDLESQALIYFCFLPITCFFTPVGPSSILLNLVFASWFGALWIPLALIPHAEPLFDLLVTIIPFQSSLIKPSPFDFVQCLLFLFFYSGVLICYEYYKRRQKLLLSLS